MRLGLGTLTELKAHLQNAALTSSTTYDTQIANLGKMMSRRFEKYCARLWEYTVGDTYNCTANRAYILLPRYPLNGTPTFQLSTGSVAPFTYATLTGILQSQTDDAGIVEFLAMQGPFFLRLLTTYTGGYWYNDDDNPTTQPAGSTARPDDLFVCWLMQCEEVWKVRDTLGINIGLTAAQKDVRWDRLQTLEFIPDVKATLDSYQRINMAG